MKNTLLLFVHYFENKRDYFECHEIMEDSWKCKAHYTKQDFEVVLILFATGLYHLRRNNNTGAIRTLRKAQFMLRQIDLSPYHQFIDIHHLDSTLSSLIETEQYRQITFPLKSEMRALFNEQYGTHSDEINDEIIHKHVRRDRTQIINARLKALNDKKPVHKSPDKCHHRNKR
ncbi:DUF309 domain-containing protein [Macrococcus armenti]|uniref:DUF309 domain-containing protein n=1 Tax=Macrococcus armenti TaxID=2875764 RepID=UPI001CCA7844|nr:DUF309 domain-containing protein [Macrococcus armenti]UBH12242.1 DUF309 domain-containing protein [Macrococcus armenti]